MYIILFLFIISFNSEICKKIKTAYNLKNSIKHLCVYFEIYTKN